MTVLAGPALVFGAGGAIGAALTRKILDSGKYCEVHAGFHRSTMQIPDAIAFRYSLDDEQSIAAAFERLPAPPALVIVASGLLHDQARGIAPEKSLRAIDAAAMAQVFAANAILPAIIAKHALPRFDRSQRSVFAVLSAKVGSIGDNRLGGWHSYRASKAALNMLVRNFAIELARTHPKAVVAALHPGTVASALSEPFQRGAAAKGLFSPDQSAEHLMDVLARLTPADSGGLFAWDGTRLPD